MRASRHLGRSDRTPLSPDPRRSLRPSAPGRSSSGGAASCRECGALVASGRCATPPPTSDQLWVRSQNSHDAGWSCAGLGSSRLMRGPTDPKRQSAKFGGSRAKASENFTHRHFHWDPSSFNIPGNTPLFQIGTRVAQVYASTWFHKPNKRDGVAVSGPAHRPFFIVAFSAASRRPAAAARRSRTSPS